MISSVQARGDASSQPSYTYQDLAWPSAAELGVVARSVNEDICNWNCTWLGSTDTNLIAKISVASEWQAQGEHAFTWNRLGDEDKSALWFSFPGDPITLISSYLLRRLASNGRATKKSTLFEDVAQHAWTDFLNVLGTLFEPSDTEIVKGSSPLDQKQVWSGAVAISVLWCDVQLSLLLNAKSYQAALRKLETFAVQTASIGKPSVSNASLIPIESAIKKNQLGLRVALSDCELDVGTLRNLRVGDVIQLSHLLLDPLYVKAMDGAPVCLGYLGQLNHLKAIELASTEAK